MYYYDFFIEKTFNQTFLFLKKYNVDFTRLTQVGYLGKLNTLFEGLSGLINTTFYLMAGGSNEFINFFFQPQAYYFFFLARHATDDFSTLDFRNLKEKNFNFDDTASLKTLSSSLFLNKYIFSTKTNFFEEDTFSSVENFFYNFVQHNISTLTETYGKPKYIYQDKF